jgi:hypothetical protein
MLVTYVAFRSTEACRRFLIFVLVGERKNKSRRGERKTGRSKKKMLMKKKQHAHEQLVNDVVSSDFPPSRTK